jgi:hypothetical protein
VALARDMRAGTSAWKPCRLTIPIPLAGRDGYHLAGRGRSIEAQRLVRPDQGRLEDLAREFAITLQSTATKDAQVTVWPIRRLI